MKISSWARHHPNSMPTASKTVGGNVNSCLAKLEAVKAGYDEAIMLGTDGLISECTGENLFIVVGEGERYIDCAGTPLPYGPQLVRDILDRTETHCSQERTFLAMELALLAEARATRLGNLT